MKRFTAWLSGLVVAILMAIGIPLFADDNNLSGEAPTQNEDGSPLTDLVEIKVYHSVDQPGGPYELVANVPFTTPGGTFEYLHSNQGDGLHCYVATAVRVGGQESVFSNEACKLIDTLLPGAPSGLTVD